MTLSFPDLPSYGISWRSIQVEPVPLLNEQILNITLKKVYQSGIQACL